ncbi:zinc finger protein 346 isoform X2 [Ambystoma mexicanum]|uniref:zinc finger protein 346 isoform X2 n=1 Tax=Ambystoma mexicanum TaxID=8296 RepID=UPI0037E9A26D
MADQEENDPYTAATEEEVHRLIRENSHIFTDTQCKVCSAVLISDSQKLAHYQSKKHGNKVRRYMAILQEGESSSAKRSKVAGSVDKSSSNSAEDRNKCCPICNMTFSAPVVAASHYEGVPRLPNSQARPGAAAPTAAPVDTSDPEKYCSLCSATFNNPMMAQQHYSGKKHKKNETKTQIMGHCNIPPTAFAASSQSQVVPGNQVPFRCDPCKITLNSVEQYQAHISGVKHKNIVRASEYDNQRPPPPPRFSQSFELEKLRENAAYRFYSNNF